MTGVEILELFAEAQHLKRHSVERLDRDAFQIIRRNGPKLAAIKLPCGRGQSWRSRPFVDDQGRVYRSTREAAKALGVSHVVVHHCLKGDGVRRSTRGHTFRYL